MKTVRDFLHKINGAPSGELSTAGYTALTTAVNFCLQKGSIESKQTLASAKGQIINVLTNREFTGKEEAINYLNVFM